MKTTFSKKLISPFLFLSPLLLLSQTIIPDSTVGLSSSLSENSGLFYLKGHLLTHTDSGGEAALYEVDTLTGMISRTVIIGNASNQDWEDITGDSTYLYIGDIGNNQGDRQDLAIYRLSIADYLSMDTIMVDTIEIAYAEQSDFTPSQFSTNFDAEALISLGDSLYVFSKNWGNGKSYVYPIPKLPGDYLVSRSDSLTPQGLITGAAYHAGKQELLLTGYTFSHAFVMRITQLSAAVFSDGTIEQSVLQLQGSFQFEGITQMGDDAYYLSSEARNGHEAALWRITFDSPLGISAAFIPAFTIFPNPALRHIKIEAAYPTKISLFTMSGASVRATRETSMNISDLPHGQYVLHVYFPTLKQTATRLIQID